MAASWPNGGFAYFYDDPAFDCVFKLGKVLRARGRGGGGGGGGGGCVCCSLAFSLHALLHPPPPSRLPLSPPPFAPTHPLTHR